VKNKFLLFVCAAIICVAGCAKTVTAPLPAGAINTFDADTFRTLADTRAAVAAIHDDVKAGKVTLDVAQLAFVDQVIKDVNLADSLYQAYHQTMVLTPAAQPNTAALTAATAVVETDFGQLTTLTQK